MPRSDKPSKVENAKAGSNFLRGTIAEVLASDAPAFEHDDIQAMKFHGIYQQDDRDTPKGEKHYSFMIRAKLPGGRLTAEQYVKMDDVANRFTPTGSLRLTTRQSFQLHGVIKGELKQTIAAMNDALVSTVAACGDIERNVMASPLPLTDPGHVAVQELAERVATELAPATGAFYEIWLDGEKALRHENEVEEPFYGPTYLPRKFKTGIALPGDNSVDVYTQDCGLIAIVQDGKITAVNVTVGGGLGMTHRKADTFARLGSHLGSVAPEHAAAAVKTAASIFRDHGNRSDRRHARLKYLVEDWGIEKFRAEFVERADFPLNDWVETGPIGFDDYLGAHEQGDGRFFYGVWVENGRVADKDGRNVKTALRAIAEQVKPRVILTPNQSILFADLSEDDVRQVESILSANGFAGPAELSGVRRYSMACPALPTCGLALAESERYLPELVDRLEDTLAKRGLDGEPMTVRMTGCPNGCARPYTADLAFVGRKPGVYDVYLGGRLQGDRLAELYAEMVDDADIVATLDPVFDRWAAERDGDESLGDFYNRAIARQQERRILTGSKDYQGRVTIEGAPVDG